MMKYKYIIAIGFICLILLTGIVLIMGIFTPRPAPGQLYLSPTPAENQVTGTQNQPSPTIGEDVNLEKAIDLMKNRQTLLSSDATVKANIIASISGNTEAAYSTNDFVIFYVPTPDIFRVEIDNANIQKVKADAVSWFMLQGMSQDGICKLPLTFYAGYSLHQQGTTYINPLPDGC